MHTMSWMEAYGKHRDPESLQGAERKARIQEIQSYLYGDPINDLPVSQTIRRPILVRARYLLVMLVVLLLTLAAAATVLV